MLSSEVVSRRSIIAKLLKTPLYIEKLRWLLLCHRKDKTFRVLVFLFKRFQHLAHSYLFSLYTEKRKESIKAIAETFSK